MVCDIKLALEPDNLVVLAPYPSISKDDNGNSYVFLVDKPNKKAIKQLVETGPYVGESVEILAGLEAGQEIVCEGKYKLKDNDLITW